MAIIRLLATSDVHGYIYPYSYATKKEENIGYAKISSLIKTLRDENTIVIDNGDVLEGSPLMFYHMHYDIDNISPVSKVLKEINYDFINIGNHDYNYGEDILLKHLNYLNGKCITANILYKGKPFNHEYVIKEIAGKRIALFGLTTQYISNWESKEHIKDSVFLDAYDTCKKLVKEIKEKENPDYIVCVYHGGFEKDLESGKPTEELTNENEGYKILEEIDGLDILITGHQHRSLSGKKFNKVYTQTSDKGKELACIEINTDTNSIDARILEANIEADTSITNLVLDEEEKCQKWLDTPLGTSNVDLKIIDEDKARLHKSQVITFLNDVSKYASGADLNANALFAGATGFNKDITMRDLVSTYVYPNTLVVKKITGKVLKEYLEKCAEYFDIKDDEIVVSYNYLWPKPQKFNYDMVDGVDYTIKVSNPIGQRLIKLTYKDKEVNDDDTFTLCINNYRASGGGDYHMIKEAPTIKDIQKGMVEILADYIIDKKVIDFKEVNNITVIR